MTEKERLAIETLLEELERRACTAVEGDDPYPRLDALDVAGFELRERRT